MRLEYRTRIFPVFRQLVVPYVEKSCVVTGCLAAEHARGRVPPGIPHAQPVFV